MMVPEDDLEFKKLQDRYTDIFGLPIVIETRDPLCVLVGHRIHRKKIEVGVGYCSPVCSPVFRQCRPSFTRRNAACGSL